MANILTRFWGPEGAREMAFQVRWLGEGRKRRSKTFKTREAAEFFADQIAPVEDRYRAMAAVKAEKEAADGVCL